MKASRTFSIFGYAMAIFIAGVRGFLDFEPEIIHQSYENNGVITGMKPQLPYGYDDHESFCRDMYPGASLIHHAEARSGRISWDLDSPFGSTEGNIIYCDAEIDGYGRRRGHFALDPEGSFYELQREGDVYFPIYDDYY